MNYLHEKNDTLPHYQHYLPEAFREFIETNFYAKVAQQTQLEHIKNDPTFLKDPIKHIALYTDHSVVHVRDVAQQTLAVIERANGILIPKRTNSQLEFIRACGLHLAYLHDIGMVHSSAFGRFMHPEFAAHFVFQAVFDQWLDLLWQENAGNIPWTLLRLFKNRLPEERIPIVFREILALSVAHSKSKLPIDLLNDPLRLRQHLLHVLSTPLEQLYYEQKISKWQRQPASEKATRKIIKFEEKQAAYEAQQLEQNTSFSNYYGNVENEAFQWLTAEGADLRVFTQNVLDAARCLRAADALRQRGTVLRTSAGYEVFVDQQTANAIFALRSENNDELYLLEGKKPLNAGEANLASSEIDHNGNLRISFHRGNFRNSEITRKAAHNAAVAINDIQADTIQSFKRNPDLDADLFEPPGRSFDAIQILLEGVEENPDFANLVAEELTKLNLELAPRIRTTVSLQGAELEEVERYLKGKQVEHFFAAEDQRAAVFEKVKQLCHLGSLIAVEDVLQEVKVVRISRGEELIKSQSSSGFVYIPLGSGLRVYPLGGYESKSTPPWIPLGNTGVIRGSVRNSSVVAETDVHALAIPREVYLQYWYHPLTTKALAELWDKK